MIYNQPMNIQVASRIKAIISKHLSPQDRIFIFGSHATGTARKWSDIDVGLSSPFPLKLNLLAHIDEELEDSDIPYKVDVVDFNRVSEEFKNIALQKTIPL